MMELRYFQNVDSLEELKRQFKQLAKKYHPDLGGSNEIMREINKEYEYLKEQLESGNGQKEKDADFDAEFRQVIMNIIHLGGIEVEICGTWIWVSGKTYPHREKLKQNGFQYSKGKKRWYWAPIKIKKKRRTNTTMEQIRFKYGSIKVNIDDIEQDTNKPVA